MKETFSHKSGVERAAPEQDDRREHSPEEIEELAMTEIKKRVAARFEGEPYHHPGHSETVEKAGEQLIDIAEKAGLSGVNDEVRRAVKFAASAHDMVIRKTVNMTPGAFGYGQVMRYRGARGEIKHETTGEITEVEKMPAPVKKALEGERWQKGNEEASWLELQHIMDETDPDGKVFTPTVRRLARGAIAATYPDVEFPAAYPSPEDVKIVNRDPRTKEREAIIDLTDFLPKKEGKPAGLKFYQPFLTPESPLAVVAIAMGDLSEGGRVDARTFRNKGNAEYWETRKLTRDRIANGFADLAENPQKQQEEMAKAAEDMLGWAQSQVGFLLWQKVRYREILETNQEINANPEAAQGFKERMDSVYSHFDANIIDAFYRSQILTGRFKQLLNPATFAQNPQAAEQLRDVAAMMDYDEFPLPESKLLP